MQLGRLAQCVGQFRYPSSRRDFLLRWTFALFSLFFVLSRRWLQVATLAFPLQIFIASVGVYLMCMA